VTTLYLVGDSVLDNGPYVPEGQTVTDALRKRGREVCLLARDGAKVADARRQLKRVPDGAPVALSAGGNDGLLLLGLIVGPSPVRSVLPILDREQREFSVRYRGLLAAAVQRTDDLRVLTIYNGDFDEEAVNAIIRPAVSIFNDTIYREARRLGVPVLDTREVMHPQHFTSAIEPNAAGSEVIASLIAASLVEKGSHP
jgi:hypothetical protein